ncbi:MAG: TetR family transcriptional regulator [Nitriliruptoraceae bacterium]
MTPTRRTRAEQQAQTRQRLIDAAEQEFTARGFEGSTIDAITERAGYTRGAFYSNFASKAELLTALGAHRISSFVRDVLPGMVGDDASDALAAARWLAEQTPATELLLLIEMARLRDTNPELDGTIRGFMSGVIEFIAEVLPQAGSERPDETPQLRAMRSRALLTVVTGVRVMRHLDVDVDPSTVAALLTAAANLSPADVEATSSEARR